MSRVTVIHGDCLDELPKLASNSVHACVCDPPYALVSIGKRFGADNAAPAKSNGATGVYARASAGFMGQKWDTGAVAFDPAMWREVLRVLKPGGHCLAFGGTRTFHRLVCAIEDAGFEVRDTIAYLYGSGFPKSHDVSKAIDKAAGREGERRATGDEVRRLRPGADQNDTGSWEKLTDRTYQPHAYEPATDAARQWAGWGTALKPAAEHIVVARKPLENSGELAIIGSTVFRLWGRLWSMLRASDAEAFSGLNPSAFAVEFGSVPWLAEQPPNTQDGSSDLTATPPSASAIISALSTVSSWNATLVDLLLHGSTSTIETGERQTTDWKTLKCSALAITPASIILAHGRGAWSIASACPAARYFHAALSRLSATLELSVLESALERGAISFPDEAAEIKPNLDLICVARKPLIGTVAANVRAFGTGALNIDACRIEGLKPEIVAIDSEARNNPILHTRRGTSTGKMSSTGRWPANVVHDGSAEVLAGFPQGGSDSGEQKVSGGAGMAFFNGGQQKHNEGIRDFGDSGSAARFFYTSKADADDRLGSKHPTVKPVDLMAWLCRLVTPPGGIVLDPFAGSGTTGMACLREGFRAILIEREASYVEDIKRRIAHVRGEDAPLFAGTAP